MAKKKPTAKAADAVIAPAAEAETSTTVENVTLTIADLQLIAQVVDLASSRGAFRAAELEQVGAVYTKLSGFLKYVASIQEKEQAAPASAESVSESASA